MDAPEHFNEDELFYTAEDCDECGCPASEFGDENWDCGAWHCPECGVAQ